MKHVLDAATSILGITGALLCLVSGGARVVGYHFVAGFESLTLFIGGIALMVAAMLGRLHLIHQDLREHRR